MAASAAKIAASFIATGTSTRCRQTLRETSFSSDVLSSAIVSVALKILEIYRLGMIYCLLQTAPRPPHLREYSGAAGQRLVTRTFGVVDLSNGQPQVRVVVKASLFASALLAVTVDRRARESDSGQSREQKMAGVEHDDCPLRRTGFEEPCCNCLQCPGVWFSCYLSNKSSRRDGKSYHFCVS